MPPSAPIMVSPCADRDWPAVLRLLTEVFVGEGYTDPRRAAEHFRRCTLEPSGLVLTAVDGESVLATLTLADWTSPLSQVAREGEAEVRLFAVSPRERGRGVGGLLLAECIRRARLPPYSAGALVLWTQPGMRAAQSLYERLGFRRVPERDGPTPASPAAPGTPSLERWAYVLPL